MLSTIFGIGMFFIFLAIAFKVGFVLLKVFFGLLGIVLLVVLTPLFIPLAALGVGVLFVAAIPILIIGIIVMIFKGLFFFI